MAILRNWLGLPPILIIFLMAVPTAVIMNMLGIGAIPIFIAAALGIIPLAGMLGEATEAVADKIGPRFGGLLNATLGNAKTDAKLLIMVVIALGIPSLFNAEIEPNVLSAEFLSLGAAVAMLVLYAFYLLFNMTNKEAIANKERISVETSPGWSMRHTAIVLVTAVALIAVLSEILVGAVEGLTESLGWSEFFVGIIIIPIVGNAAEHTVAIQQALKNEMDLSLSIAIGSSLQIALFVAPLLVFISLLVGNPIQLEFDHFEIAAITSASAITAFVSLDGESNWLEGVLLLTVYAILGVGFFFL